MKEPVDILFIGFVLGHGGDAVQMLELAAGMASRGCNVRVVVPEVETSQGFSALCQARGVPLERNPLIHADAQGGKQNFPRLLRFFSTHRHAAVVHVHTGDVCLPRQAMVAMRLMCYPKIFVTVQSPYTTIEAGSARASFWAGFVQERLHRLICPSEHSRQAQLAFGVPEAYVVTIHNSVDLPRFQSGEKRSVWKALGCKETDRLLLFTSRIDAQKRPLDALAAFANVAAEFPDARFVFAGRGNLEGDLRSAAAQAGLERRVHFVGHQSNIPDWLAAATVWMLPTESENFSLAILEALAAGCPILSTMCPGNDEVLRDGENALTTAVGDVEAQTRALRRLLAEPELRARLSAGAKHTAEAYRAERMVDRYAECYGALLPR